MMLDVISHEDSPSSSQEKENIVENNNSKTSSPSVIDNQSLVTKLPSESDNSTSPEASSSTESSCLKNDSKSNTSKNKKAVNSKKELTNTRKKRKRSKLQDRSSSSPSIDILFKKIKSESKSACAIIDISGDSNDASENNKGLGDLSLSTSNSSSTDSICVNKERPPKCHSKLEQSMITNASSLEESNLTPSQKEKKNLTESLMHKKKLFKKLTPKQISKQRELKEKQEERSKKKIEKEILKKSKEEEKLKLQEEKQKQKEEREKKKREENELREKEKEEKRQKKEEEKIKREEAKQKKEEDRLRKEEEKRLAEEEEKEKKEKAKAKFAEFFVAKKEIAPPQTSKENIVGAGGFMTFEIKENMRMAPLTRTSLSAERKSALDSFLESEKDAEEFMTYLKEIKSSYTPGKSFQTYPPEEKHEDMECEVIEEEEEFGLDEDNVLVKMENSSSNKVKVKAKLFQFCENQRPAYFGTWNKVSSVISGRKPFGKEAHILDYDYDSDDDWEAEGIGESLSGSESENEEEEGGDQMEYDEFFVPHGYLSSDEAPEDEDGLEEDDDSEDKPRDSDAQKELLRQKQVEFELERKEETKVLKPKIYGCIWLGERDCHHAYDRLLKIFANHQAINISGTAFPLIPRKNSSTNLDASVSKDGNRDEPGSVKRLGKNFPEIAIPDLIRMLHGNRNSKPSLIKEFFKYWPTRNKKDLTDGDKNGDLPSDDIISRRKIEQKIKELAVYGKFTEDGISHKHRTWFVSKEIREKYGLTDLSFQNSWKYVIPPKEWPCDDKIETDPTPDSESEATPKPKSATNLITKFTKVLTEEEKEEERKRNLLLTPKTPLIASQQNTPSNTSSCTQPDLVAIPIVNLEDQQSSASGQSKKRSSSPPCPAKKKKRISFITLTNNENLTSNLKQNSAAKVFSSDLHKTEISEVNKNTKISRFFLKSKDSSHKGVSKPDSATVIKDSNKVTKDTDKSAKENHTKKSTNDEEDSEFENMDTECITLE